MIGRLKGNVIEKLPPFLIVDVNGVGFSVSIPVSAFEKIALNSEVFLYTKCLIKEEESFIYGFLSFDELSIFEELISVPGVGPRSALNILSNLSPEEIAKAVDDENLGVLSSITRIGQKLASKIILELKGKLDFAKKSNAFSQALNALCALGLNRNEAIERLRGLPQNLSVEEMVKKALKK
jgi:Holliday junction DNA helicase RuvA